MGMAPIVRVLATVTLAATLAACSGGDAGGGGSAAGPHRTTTSSAPDTTTTTPAAAGLSARVELGARRVQAGGSIDATVVVTNRTGHVVTASGCGSLFGVSLTNDTVPPNTNQLACLQQFTITEGTSTYPLKVVAVYPACVSTPQAGFPSCEPGTGVAPLPPGKYGAVLGQPGNVVPAPAPIAVVVT